MIRLYDEVIAMGQFMGLVIGVDYETEEACIEYDLDDSMATIWLPFRKLRKCGY